MEPITFDKAFDRLIGVEAGYVNDPQDPGGETKWGISKRSYPNLDIKNLTRDQAKEIYLRDFWNVLGDTPDSIKFQVFDFAVNSGIQTAVRKLQQAVGTPDDGHWGPRSGDALKQMELHEVLMRLLSLRLTFMTGLKNWDRDGRGWSRRIAQNLIYGTEDV